MIRDFPDMRSFEPTRSPLQTHRNASLFELRRDPVIAESHPKIRDGVNGGDNTGRPRPNSRVASRQIDHQARSRPDSSPEPLEATAGDPCVMDRVFRISMPEIILDQPEIVASVGEVEAARVP